MLHHVDMQAGSGEGSRLYCKWLIIVLKRLQDSFCGCRWNESAIIEIKPFYQTDGGLLMASRSKQTSILLRQVVFHSNISCYILTVELFISLGKKHNTVYRSVEWLSDIWTVFLLYYSVFFPSSCSLVFSSKWCYQPRCYMQSKCDSSVDQVWMIDQCCCVHDGSSCCIHMKLMQHDWFVVG